jgi:predicted alpha/beta-fold hydrolase
VLAATHPGRPTVGADPLAFGVHYDPVSFLSEDNVKLEGWLVPAFDAKDVIREGEKALQKRWPAVVLVHDFAGSRQQLLPLVKPLHERGFVVLLLALRGGQSLTGDAQTFGLRESMDVTAGVEMLRRRAFIDPSKIAVLGTGTGANAALMAAKKDKSLAALVLSNPVDGFDSAFARRVGENHAWLPPLRTMFRWTFQVMYSVDAEDLNLSNYKDLMAARPILLMPSHREILEPTAIRDVEQFLAARMGLPDVVAHAK